MKNIREEGRTAQHAGNFAENIGFLASPSARSYNRCISGYASPKLPFGRLLLSAKR